MKYYLSKLVKGEFMDMISQVTSLLNEEGFGILSEINVQDTLKKSWISIIRNTQFSELATHILPSGLFRLKTKSELCCRAM